MATVGKLSPGFACQRYREDPTAMCLQRHVDVVPCRHPQQSPMPSDPHQSHLFIIEDDKGEREFLLNNPIYSIGRDSDCDIRLVSQFVSRRHATLVQALNNEDDSYSYRIIDGDPQGKPSSNGLLINGRKLYAHKLQHQDKVIFGPQVSATYLLLRRDAVMTTPPDEFDITLISPNMVGEPEDDTLNNEEFVENGSTRR